MMNTEPSPAPEALDKKPAFLHPEVREDWKMHLGKAKNQILTTEIT